ncbi:TolC family protein [Mucilaginibacter conchicola]|uniref:TolC family protein n=1 Tax=Mucilaginibacter conchicola TaxID=2303333 RepID=A0A372NSS3_9SPHI|nr:TolC family protein [Mucilaginibacter conchicola]RFZ92306.1 TolC family protein [Mucilaginibacter conchicola]
MYNFNKYKGIGILAVCLAVAGCKVPAITKLGENKPMPGVYNNNADTTNIATLQWRDFFTDANLVNLIDTALKNNQELMSTLQEIEVAKSDIGIRQGALSPTVGLRGGAGLEKAGRYTSQGAGDASTDITPGREVPDPLADYRIAAYADWEVDIWKKLHNAKKAAVARYLSSVEGRNFVVTNLISEIANAYYELQSLDTQLAIVRQSIEVQKNALAIVKVQKEAARVTELAVQKFQAEILDSQELEYETLQKIRETENDLNLLLGRYPQEIVRSKNDFLTLTPAAVHTGIPSQLLANRPDVKKAELDLVAAKLDVKVARAEFYPSFNISAALGFQAFKPSYLFKYPGSLIYSVAGEIAAPLINRAGIRAEFNSANARQLQALYNYQKVILNAYMEVNTQMYAIDNLEKRYSLKSQQADALIKSVDISNKLFKAARADYFEVLMTQRDALATRLELVETKKAQLTAVNTIYRNLGGGWR